MLTVLCGLPASGKTTWRKANADGSDVICLDEIREELSGDASCQRFNENVMMVAVGRAKDALADERDLIVDATNLTREYRAKWIELAEEHDQPARCVYFPISVEVALERNEGRERRVPKYAMERMAHRLQRPEVEEGFEGIEVVRATDSEHLRD